MVRALPSPVPACVAEAYSEVQVVCELKTRPPIPVCPAQPRRLQRQQPTSPPEWLMMC